MHKKLLVGFQNGDLLIEQYSEKMIFSHDKVVESEIII